MNDLKAVVTRSRGRRLTTVRAAACRTPQRCYVDAGRPTRIALQWSRRDSMRAGTVCGEVAAKLTTYVALTTGSGHFPRTVPPLDNFSSPFTWCRSFPPSTTTIRRSTIKRSRLTCTKLTDVDRLGSGVRISASFPIFALTAGRMS